MQYKYIDVYKVEKNKPTACQYAKVSKSHILISIRFQKCY